MPTNASLSEDSLNLSNVTQSNITTSSQLSSSSSRPQSDHSYSLSVVRDTVDESVSHLHSVPEVSYSSSDDDDFYFDASEETSVKANPIKQVKEVSDDLKQMNLENSSVNNSIDYDKMYSDEEDELGSIENHGSVISHLISQVKIGMDLTKVVLPTFILERRSLLEMYADFFAHPDLFIRYCLNLLFLFTILLKNNLYFSITDCETPQDRMIQVLRWYLSAFHAGRKSSIAKKPYNPILGEVFKCYWNVPSISQNSVESN